MDITFVTTTSRDDEAMALLREMGMPFRGADSGSGRRRNFQIGETSWHARH